MQANIPTSLANPPAKSFLTAAERDYSDTLIRGYDSPYAIQLFGENWKTRYQTINDKLIQDHLNQRFWLGSKACWYPYCYCLDIDSPTPETLEKIEAIFEKYSIKESQRLYVTSPSYQKSGNFRIYFRLEYADKLPTFNLGRSVLERVFREICEIYPQRRRKDRLPFGKDSHIISDGVVLSQLTWEQELHWLKKLDPIDVDVFPRQPVIISPDAPDAPAITPTGDVADLIAHGLQNFGTRHKAQHALLNFFWRKSWLPEDSAKQVKKWIRKNHNGFSKDVNQANWRTIDAEIDRQTEAIYSRKQLSDNANNLCNLITKADLLEAARLFPGDVVNQKSFIALVAYVRPRSHHDWVFIPAHVWRVIADKDRYHNFINELESRGIIAANRQYKVGLFSRRFRLALPNDSLILCEDGRNASDYYSALRIAFDTKREIAEAMQINERTIRRHFSES
jgi:hypothetical protein